MTVARSLFVVLAAIGLAACGERPAALSDAESTILDRIRRIRELRAEMAESWPGFDSEPYDTPLLYLTDSVCYAVDPGKRFRERHGARLVFRGAGWSLYKTALPDSLPFHMETKCNFSDSTAFNSSIPYLFCSSPELTRIVETSVTSDSLWFPMVLHEYAHGFQLRQPGFMQTFRGSIADLPEMELAALHKRCEWFNEAVRAENTELLAALAAADTAERNTRIMRFKALRRARKQRMSAELGDSLVRTEAIYETMEGMARFVEAQTGFALGSYTEADDWLRDTDRSGYFFATGYNLVRLLDRCGVDRTHLFAVPFRPLELFLTTTQTH